MELNEQLTFLTQSSLLIASILLLLQCAVTKAQVDLPPGSEQIPDGIIMIGNDESATEPPRSRLVPAFRPDPNDRAEAAFEARWTQWSEWGVCRDSQQMRVRGCYKIGGFSCVGDRVESKWCRSSRPSETAEERPFEGVRVDNVRPHQPVSAEQNVVNSFALNNFVPNSQFNFVPSPHRFNPVDHEFEAQMQQVEQFQQPSRQSSVNKGFSQVRLRPPNALQQHESGIPTGVNSVSIFQNKNPNQMSPFTNFDRFAVQEQGEGNYGLGPPPTPFHTNRKSETKARRPVGLAPTPQEDLAALLQVTRQKLALQPLPPARPNFFFDPSMNGAPSGDPNVGSPSMRSRTFMTPHATPFTSALGPPSNGPLDSFLTSPTARSRQPLPNRETELKAEDLRIRVETLLKLLEAKSSGSFSNSNGVLFSENNDDSPSVRSNALFPGEDQATKMEHVLMNDSLNLPSFEKPELDRKDTIGNDGRKNQMKHSSQILKDQSSETGDGSDEGAQFKIRRLDNIDNFTPSSEASSGSWTDVGHFVAVQQASDGQFDPEDQLLVSQSEIVFSNGPVKPHKAILVEQRSSANNVTDFINKMFNRVTAKDIKDEIQASSKPKWTEWSRWSQCKCRTKDRYRTCTSPTSAPGETLVKGCVGPATDVQPCYNSTACALVPKSTPSLSPPILWSPIVSPFAPSILPATFTNTIFNAFKTLVNSSVSTSLSQSQSKQPDDPKSASSSSPSFPSMRMHPLSGSAPEVAQVQPPSFSARPMLILGDAPSPVMVQSSPLFLPAAPPAYFPIIKRVHQPVQLRQPSFNSIQPSRDSNDIQTNSISPVFQPQSNELAFPTNLRQAFGRISFNSTSRDDQKQTTLRNQFAPQKTAPNETGAKLHKSKTHFAMFDSPGIGIAVPVKATQYEGSFHSPEIIKALKEALGMSVKSDSSEQDELWNDS